MIARCFIVAMLLQIGASAQLQLFQYDGTKETPVAGLFAAGSASPGDTLDLRFRVRNSGAGPASVQTIVVAGYGFRLSGQPLLPYVLASQAEVEFHIAFAPTTPGTYSAALAVNTINVTITAASVASALLSFGQTQIGAGSTADFGQIQWGTSVAKTFTLSNPYSTPITVGAIAVSGDAFQGPAGISTPLQIPATSSVTFQIFFAPKVSGQATGTLAIDQRVFQLIGLGLVPPLPKGTIVVNSQTAASAQQLNITIALAAVSQTPGNGTLTMTFQPATGLLDDAAIQFLSGARRSASVSIAAGDSFARINGQSSFAFQTGTTAGTLVFALTLPNSSDQYNVPIAPAMVSVTTATGEVRVNDFDVNIAGFDNTHSVSQLAFTFYDTAGNVIQPGTIGLDATASFRTYFAANQAGGAFTMRATFPLTGDPTKVSGVDVRISNSAGIVATPRITF